MTEILLTIIAGLIAVVAFFLRQYVHEFKGMRKELTTVNHHLGILKVEHKGLTERVERTERKLKIA